MLPAQLSVQAGGFRNNILHWWRNSSKTNIIGCRNIAILGRRVLMAELKALGYNNSSYDRVSVLYKVPSVLYILSYWIFTAPSWVLLSYHFSGEKDETGLCPWLYSWSSLPKPVSGPFKILSEGWGGGSGTFFSWIILPLIFQNHFVWLCE